MVVYLLVIKICKIAWIFFLFLPLLSLSVPYFTSLYAVDCQMGQDEKGPKNTPIEKIGIVNAKDVPILSHIILTRFQSSFVVIVLRYCL